MSSSEIIDKFQVGIIFSNSDIASAGTHIHIFSDLIPLYTYFLTNKYSYTALITTENLGIRREIISNRLISRFVGVEMVS